MKVLSAPFGIAKSDVLYSHLEVYDHGTVKCGLPKKFALFSYSPATVAT